MCIRYSLNQTAWPMQLELLRVFPQLLAATLSLELETHRSSATLEEMEMSTGS